MASKRAIVHRLVLAIALALAGTSTNLGQTQPPAAATDYEVGAQDVLTITSYDQADLSGRFAVEADGTFTYPMIGRFKAGGFTLRQVEENLKKRLKDEGYFRNPQVTVAVEQYKRQKIFIVSEGRTPGTYTLSGPEDARRRRLQSVVRSSRRSWRAVTLSRSGAMAIRPAASRGLTTA